MTELQAAWGHVFALADQQAVVLVGRLTPTDANPGETDAPYEAFLFKSREAALNWDQKPWYPDALILDVTLME